MRIKDIAVIIIAIIYSAMNIAWTCQSYFIHIEEEGGIKIPMGFNGVKHNYLLIFLIMILNVILGIVLIKQTALKLKTLNSFIKAVLITGIMVWLLFYVPGSIIVFLFYIADGKVGG